MNVRRLHLANLYGQAKENLTRLFYQLSLDEPPSAEQLVVGENLMIDAGGDMLEAKKQTLEVAEMNLEIAAELVNTTCYRDVLLQKDGD